MNDLNAYHGKRQVVAPGEENSGLIVDFFKAKDAKKRLAEQMAGGGSIEPTGVEAVGGFGGASNFGGIPA